MSSKRHSDVLGVGRKAKRQRQRRHLYFVVDDGDGYAIRKMDLSSEYESDDDAARHEDGEIETVGAAWSPLPEALIRLPAQTGEFFVASGTKILVTDCGWPEHAVPVFDVHSRSLTLGPRPHSRTCPHTPIYMPVGRNVVSVDAGSSTKLLYPPPPERRAQQLRVVVGQAGRQAAVPARRRHLPRGAPRRPDALRQHRQQRRPRYLHPRHRRRGRRRRVEAARQVEAAVQRPGPL